MADNDTKVFISYAREDYATAKELYDDLKKSGVKPWMDRIDLLIGQDWKFEIRRAIEASSHFIALLSSNSISKKGYVQKELKLALDIFDEMPKTEIFLLPVRLDDCNPLDETLRGLHWGDLFPEYKDGLDQILRVLAPEKKEGLGTIRIEASRSKKKKKPVTESKVKEIDRDDRFIAYDDGTVRDTETGLMWAAKDNGEDLDWYDAKKYCKNYTGGGYADWRLPTLDELEGLYKTKTRLIERTGWWLWSSEYKKTKDGSLAAFCNFSNGARNWDHPDSSNYGRVLPVRGGN